MSSSDAETLKAQAEELKKKGNDAYVGKDYEKAIEFYSEALNIDPNNAVLFSNRSACFAARKEWQKAYEDAIQSISKDPKFVKGYFRLSSAQIELKLFDDAEATLKAALTIDPENEIIPRQIKIIRQKKANTLQAVQKAPTNQPKKLDEAQMKELMELQEQVTTHNKDLRGVKVKIGTLQREARVNAVTSNHIETLPENVPLYRSVGKAFFLNEKKEIQDRLEKQIAEITQAQRDLTDRQEYLERRIASTTTNMQDLCA